MTLSRTRPQLLVSRTIFVKEASTYTGFPTRLIGELLRASNLTSVDKVLRAGANYDQVGSYSKVMIRKTTLYTVYPAPYTTTGTGPVERQECGAPATFRDA